MTETAPIPFPTAPRRAALLARLGRPSGAPGLAEAGADDLRELVRDLRRSVAWLEADNRRLAWALRSRLLPLAWQAVLSAAAACAVIRLTGL